MSEEKNFDQMIDESVRSIHTGEIVEGTVIDVKPDRITLNINYKYDGIITRDEYSNNPAVDLTAEVAEGDTIEAKVLRIQDSEVQLSYKRISEEKASKRVEEAFNNKEKLTVKVEKITSGGLITSFEGASIFVPASLVSDVYEKNLDKYLGEEIEVIVTEFNPRKRRVIGNRKKILQETRAERAKALLESLRVNDIVEGEVKSVTSFGAFIDLGGVDGLLHISEMSWAHVTKPGDCLKVGDEVEVFIKSVDKESGKISLSRKFADQDPWLHAAEKYAVGSVVSCKVARMLDYGAFVELEPGLDALLHVSQIAREHIEKPQDVLSVGQEIEAEVLEINNETRRISISMKKLLPPVEEAEEAAVEAEAAAEEEAPATEE